jgi:hypothetical protein
MSERAGLFDGDTDFDVAGFAPRKSVPPTESASPEKIRKVSEASSFRSREPIPAKLPPAPKREPRRHRTGRNVQLSLKVRAETAEAFYALADEGGWVLGEALDRAVAALRRELGAKKTV